MQYGAWSDTVFTTSIDLNGILADSMDFRQYKAILQTTNPLITPVLYDVAVIYYVYLGINTGVLTDCSLAPDANPSFGSLAVLVSVPQQEIINLVLHDITGRVITRYSQELPCGMHSVYFNSLPQGLYFCKMCAGEFTATERVVVLR